jgi:outer membrane protein TolC
MIVHPIHAFTPEQTPPFDRTLFQVLGHVSYTLFDGGARSSRIEGSRANEGAADELVSGTEQVLLSLVIGSYLEALGLSQGLEAHDRSITALESELSRVRQLFDVGRAAQIEVLRVEAAIASAEAERVGVASSLDRAERNLARWTGASVAETRAEQLAAVSIAESPVPPREDLREQALAESPAVRAARQGLEAAEAAVVGARSARVPDVSVGGSYINYGSGSGVNQLEWNVGVQVTYPLFTGGAISSSIARARANERRAAEEVRVAESEVEQDLDRALSGIEEARARVRSLTTAVRRYEEVVRIERLRLDTGTGTQTDYLQSEADLLSTRADLIRARYVVIFAWAELARATGQLTRDWVEGNVRNEP